VKPSLETIQIELKKVASQYPALMVSEQQRDIPRVAFNIGLVAQRRGGNVRICDLGGGIGLFSVGCAALGMKSTLVDDFSDNVNRVYAEVPATLHARYGVEVVSTDVVDAPPTFASGSFDVVTTFDSMEHWHHSPKRLFSETMRWLKPGGLLIIGVPNCVNLRKRLTVPFGIGRWSPMEEWYEASRFRGHVREPDTNDLRYIAKDLALENVEIIGRNWLGYVSRFAWVRGLTPLVDGPLRLFPSLCADLYLLGNKAP
jgi:SAM-dependent methyltransferase